MISNSKFIKLKHYIVLIKGRNPKHFSDDSAQLPYLSMEYLRGKSIDVKYAVCQKDLVKVNQNDVLILWDGANAGEIMLSKEGYLSSTMAWIKPNESIISKSFLYYLLRSYESVLKDFSNGTTIPHLDPSILLHSPFFIPSLTFQSAIARFLDKKTSLIDKAIDIKQKQIALLKERRQIIIQQAVTRGLDQNVKMKDSGVEWIGEVPEGWEVVRLKNVAKIKYGLGQPPKEKPNGLPIIRATNVERGMIVEKGLIFVDPDDVPWERDPILKENDIIVVRSGAYTGDSAIVTEKYVGAIAGYDMVMTPRLINGPFLAISMLAPYVLYHQLYLLRMRAAQPHLNAEELGETLIVQPSLKCQVQIVEYIAIITQKNNKAISLKEKEIEKLKEYKATLINSAVTGKIKVC